MIKKALSIFMFCCTLTACGFHLQGHSTSKGPNIPLHLQNNGPHHVFYRRLRQRLRQAPFTLMSSEKDALYQLHLDNTQLQKSLSIVGANTQIRQYVLRFHATLRVLKKGKLLAPIHITKQRFYTVNNDQLLGSRQEQMTLVRELQDDALQSIVNRLSTLIKPSAHENKSRTAQRAA